MKMAIDWLNVGWLMWLIDWLLDRFNFDWLIDNQECILIIDHETGELTLERLSHQVNIYVFNISIRFFICYLKY